MSNTIPSKCITPELSSIGAKTVSIKSWIFKSMDAANINIDVYDFKQGVAGTLEAHQERWIFKRYSFFKNEHATTLI